MTTRREFVVTPPDPSMHWVTGMRWAEPIEATNGGLNPDPNARQLVTKPYSDINYLYHSYNQVIGFWTYVRKAWYNLNYTASKMVGGTIKNPLLDGSCCPKIKTQIIIGDTGNASGAFQGLVKWGQAATQTELNRVGLKATALNFGETLQFDFGQQNTKVSAYPVGEEQIIHSATF